MQNLSTYMLVLCLAALPLAAEAAPVASGTAGQPPVAARSTTEAPDYASVAYNPAEPKPAAAKRPESGNATHNPAEQAPSAGKQPEPDNVAYSPAELTPDTADTYQSSYELYLGGDTSYPLIETRRGTAWYLDISSIYAELYAPPEYILTAYVIKLDDADKGNNVPGRMVPLRLRYNTRTMTMYYDRDIGKDNWVSVVPFDGWLRTGVVLPAGEAIYYLFYQEKFFGRRKYNITLRGKVMDKDYPFPDSFYTLLKGQASPNTPVPATTDLKIK